MNKYIIVAILFLTPMSLYAAADDIVGDWMEDKGTGATKFERVGENKYKGVCSWLKDNKDKDGGPRRDRKNPDKSMRSQHIVGAHVMDLTYDPQKKRYNMDWAYDPSWGLAVDNSGYMTVSGDTITIKAGWAFIKVTKRMHRIVKSE